MQVTVAKALSGYFNVEGGTGSLAPESYGRSAKRPLTEFAAELKALTPEEKHKLAQGVCAITGDTLRT